MTIGESEFTTNDRYVVRVSAANALDYKFVVNAVDLAENESITTLQAIETYTNGTKDGGAWNGMEKIVRQGR